MFRKFIYLAVAAVMIGSGTAGAQQVDEDDFDRTRRTNQNLEQSSYMALNANYAFNYEGDEEDPGVYLSGRYGMDYHRNLAFEIETGAMILDMEIEGAGDQGTLWMFPVLANVVIKEEIDRFTPYLSGGFGAFFFAADEEDNRGEVDVDNISIGWKLAAGADYWFSETMAANLETGYFFVVDPDIEGGTIPGERELDMDTWYIGAGIKWRFG